MAAAVSSVAGSNKALGEFKVLPNTHKIMLQVCKSHSFIKFHFLQVVETWVAAVDLVSKVAGLAKAEADLARAAAGLAKVAGLAKAAVVLVAVDLAKAAVGLVAVDLVKAAVGLAVVANLAAVVLVKAAAAVGLAKVAVPVGKP